MRVLSWKHLILWAVLIGFGMGRSLSLASAATKDEKQLQTFIDGLLAKVKPLEKESALAWWNAAVTGEDQYYEQQKVVNLKIREIYSDRGAYEYLKAIKDSDQITNPLLRRQAVKLFHQHVPNQIDPELVREQVELSTEIEQNFSAFRGKIDGQTVTDNAIKSILRGSSDSVERRKAWLASKQVGPVVRDDIVTLVKLRNKGARALGFDNFHTMSLILSEQDPDELDKLFDELDTLTAKPFATLKTELDTILAKNCGVRVDELRPWHYHDPFFQEAPQVDDVDLNRFYTDKNIAQVAETFYRGIGLDVKDILERSDLYEKDGKNPHAFCTHIDREGDVRILCNIQPNENWMEVTLHELGHGVYDKYLSRETPYFLREPAHIFTTEAIAMFFGRLSQNPVWMQKNLNLSDAQLREIEEVCARSARLKQLVFARWAAVMFRFEQQLYANPDQDLDTLWWRIVKKYQGVQAPEGRQAPDWAAKIHFTVAPCYYHNYMLGELFASQLHNQVVTQVLDDAPAHGYGYVGKPQVGDWLRTQVFEVGAEKPWNDMVRSATGESLTAKYFVEQFVR